MARPFAAAVAALLALFLAGCCMSGVAAFIRVEGLPPRFVDESCRDFNPVGALRCCAAWG